MLSFSEALDITAARLPDAIAVVDGERAQTFSQYRRAVLDLARHLASLTAPGASVGLLGTNSLEYTHVLWAAPCAGRTLAVLNYRLHVAEMKAILTDAEAEVLIVGPGFHEHAATLLDEVDSLRAFVTYDESGTWNFGATPARLADESAPQTGAWLYYTSGTTGQPKGVLLPQSAVMTAALSYVLGTGIRPSDSVLMVLPLCHVVAHLLPGLYLLGTTVRIEARFDVDEFLTTCVTSGLTTSIVAPIMLRQIVDHRRFPTVSTLRNLGYGGAPAELATVEAALAARPDLRLFQGLGMTETDGTYLLLDADDHWRAVQGALELLGSVGRPLPFVRVGIVDDAWEPVAQGTTGELVVAGRQIMAGYWRNPTLTADTIVDGWLRTGDLATRGPDGLTYLADRKKDMIITGGLNVYSLEVENVLSRHPRIAEVAVFGTPDERWGERVVAAVIPRAGGPLTEAEVQDYARSSLAGFKVPKHVVFVSDLPRNAYGKVLKKQLRAACGA